MSFSFRNLFSQDETGEALGDRSGAGLVPGSSRSQVFEVSELLPFIPKAIAAQSGIPMDKSVQIPLPEEGQDVRLSTIYQICPALFAAEITPLNDSIVSLPANPSENSEAVSQGFSAPNGNPFADAAVEEEELPESRRSVAAVAEEKKEVAAGFGFSGMKAGEPQANPFSDLGPGPQPGPEAVQQKPAPFSSALQENAFGGTPEQPKGNPFEDATSFEDIMKSKSSPEETPAAPSTPPAEPAPKSSGPSFKAPERSFSTLFSQQAEEDQNISEASDSPLGKLFKEATGEYVGPPEKSDSLFGDLNQGGGFEAFIPPGMEDTQTPEALPKEEIVPPMVFSNDDSDPVPAAEEPEPPTVMFSQETEETATDSGLFQQNSPFGPPPVADSSEGEDFSAKLAQSIFGSSPEGEPKEDSAPSPFHSLTNPEAKAAEVPPAIPEADKAEEKSATPIADQSSFFSRSPIGMESPAPTQPSAFEKPPVAEQPPAFEKPPVAEQPPAFEKPPVAEQPPAFEKPPVAEQPPAFEKPPVAEQPPAFEKPPVAEQPPAIEEPPVAEQPPAFEKPSVAEQPPAIEKPPVAEQPPAIEKPPVAEQPPAIEKPPVAEQPPAFEKPPVAEQPPAFEKPPVAEQPPAIEEPPVAEQPPAIEKPPVAEQPPAIEKPLVAEQPPAIEEPPVAEQPPAIEKPPVAEEPPAADQPPTFEEPKAQKAEPAPEPPQAEESPAETKVQELEPAPESGISPKESMQKSGHFDTDFFAKSPVAGDEKPPVLKNESEPQPQPEPKPVTQAVESRETDQSPNQAVVIPAKLGNNQSIVVQPPVTPEIKPEPETNEVPIKRREPINPAMGGSADEMRDIELRAIFNTDENFTLRKVSQKVAAMDGIHACAVVTTDRVIEAYADQTYAIGDKIQTMAEHVRGLAEMSGIGGASYFTIYMDRSVMSFFFGGKNLLGVKHKSDAFKPGTREKLILVARSLDTLEN
ncbi:MAG: hypothetical protein P1U89_17590 [Verrucomicrobiales bacterium]|nr:hypothetical protein [Verrucomicrobiales bacterium]